MVIGQTVSVQFLYGFCMVSVTTYQGFSKAVLAAVAPCTRASKPASQRQRGSQPVSEPASASQRQPAPASASQRQPAPASASQPRARLLGLSRGQPFLRRWCAHQHEDLRFGAEQLGLSYSTGIKLGLALLLEQVVRPPARGLAIWR